MKIYDRQMFCYTLVTTINQYYVCKIVIEPATKYGKKCFHFLCHPYIEFTLYFMYICTMFTFYIE